MTPAELPESLLHTVIRTRESVILDDASAPNPFSADEYLRQKRARSVLGLPLVKQARLIGVLYLENNLTPHVFTPARLAVLKLLASQAAISLENARLYGDLEEREAKIRRLVDANIIGIFVWSLDGEILEANEAFLHTVGYDREDLASGRLRWTDLTPAEWLDRDLQQLVPELKMRGSLQPFEKEYFRKDGSRVPVLIGVAALDEGCNQGVAFVLDLTERKRADEERARMLRAEAANRAKDEFLANVSHEIRTPMNAILGMTDLALDTPLAEDQRQYLKTVKSAADNLLGMINDLLDFSKIEAGKLELDPADFSLRAAVGDTLRALAVRAHTKGLELIYDVQPEVPDALVGDAGRLRQVLLNLVGNAIKFTEAGRGGRARGSRRRPGTRGRRRPAVHRARHRHRHPAGPAGADLPGLRAGGHLDHAEVRRHRAGPDDRRPAGGPDGRADHRGERAGPGQHLRLHGAVRAPAAPHRAPRRPAAGPAPGPAGPRG